MTSLYEISCYGIEQTYHTDPARLALFFYRAYYMTLFNTFALHAGLNGLVVCLSAKVADQFETHTILCSIAYVLLLVQCLVHFALFFP